MSQEEEWDPILVRQLKRSSMTVAAPTDVPEMWRKFLKAVQDHYHHIEQDRALLNRSLEVSTEEMMLLKAGLEEQRDQLRGMIIGVSDALSWFASIVGETSENSTSSRPKLESAKRELFHHLASVFGDSMDSETTSYASGIHANLARLADDLVRLVSQTAQQASLRKELEVAAAVQQMLVPSGSLTSVGGIESCAFFRSAAECGGDWWGLHQHQSGGALVFVGDVTGHGVPAAIITGAAKAACDVACSGRAGPVTPQGVLEAMSASIFATAQRHIMMTCVATLFNPQGGEALIANAGHPFPYQIRAGVARQLVSHGQPLGAAPDNVYDTIRTDIKPGDIFVWFTDGIIECENDRDEQFGERRLRAICQRAATSGVVAVRDAVVEALDTFRGGRPQGDDITLVVATVK